MKNRGLSNGVAGLLFVISLLISGDGSCRDYHIYDTLLYFELQRDTIFIRGTADDTIGYIDFLVKRDESISGIVEMQFQFTADTSVVEIIGASTSENWPCASASLSNPNGDSTMFEVFMSCGDSIVVGTSSVCYATVTCRLKCVGENTNNPLTLSGTSDNYIAYRIGGNEYHLEIGDTEKFTHGILRSADYEATTRIDTVEVIGGIGIQCTVPVYYTSNFKTFNIRQFVVFDTSQLQFNLGYVADSTIWGISSFVRNKDTLKIHLYSVAPEYEAEEELYYLKFTTLADEDWAGNDYSCNLSFFEDSCYINVGPSTFCTELQMPYDLVDGSVRLGTEVQILTDFHSSGCDSIISKTDNESKALVRIMGDFPAGGASNNITINYLASPFNYDGFDDIVPGRVDFSLTLNDPDTISVHSTHQDTLDNFFPQSDTLINMFWVELGLDLGDGDVTSYQARYRKPAYADAPIQQYPTKVSDPTGTIVLGYNSLTLLRDSVKVLVSEAGVSSVSATTCSTVTGELRVRNDFDLDTISFYVNTSGSITIDGVVPSITGILATKISNQSYRIYSNQSFAGITDNGNGYTKLADIKYKPPCSGTPQQTYSCKPSFTSGYVGYSTGQAFFVKDTLGTVAITIPSGGCSCGGGQAPPPKTNPLIPSDFALHYCYPNPFNMQTVIPFDLPRNSEVLIEVRNILGEKVAILVNETVEAGSHEAVWDGRDEHGRDVASGIYFYHMRAGDYRKTNKMVLLK
ncbi:MAG: T9SS type A sorting domain-containing protein [Nitrososphaera sp.]|jgi:hypothetical protein